MEWVPERGCGAGSGSGLGAGSEPNSGARSGAGSGACKSSWHGRCVADDKQKVVRSVVGDSCWDYFFAFLKGSFARILQVSIRSLFGCEKAPPLQ